MQTSCDESREVDDRLRATHVPDAINLTAEEAAAPEIEPTAIALVEDLDSRFVSQHVAPTGSGKSDSIG
jgi:hypothetical protein